MSKHSAQSLGRYTIHAELGKGGFATVYRATDTVLERDVALKILKPGWTDDAKAVERFMREAKQASRLRHTNIVTIYDVGQAEGRLFIAMELVRGRSLQQIIAEEGTLPWPRVLAILEQSAAALDYAHGEGLVHRDVKPANIILDESKPGSAVHVMLTDFGLVRGAEQASLSMGSTGGLLGTPEYIPPEIWDGEPATTASDIYALGCVAFYLLTGKVLFSATTPMAVLKRHAEGPVFPQQWPSGVPAGADAVLRRALAKDPNQRQTSAAELAGQLRACEGQAAREQAATEQEAKRQEEAARAAQVASAAEAAHRAEEERARQEAERQAKEEADRKAREEQERQRQVELAAQTAAAEKAKRAGEERERQKQAREAARLAEEEARHRELAAQQPVIAKSVQSTQTATPAKKAKSNRTWLYVAGGIVAVIAIVVVLASINPAPAAVPTAAPATQPTVAPATQPAAAPATAGGAIKLAVLAPLTGSMSTFGISTRDGALMAIDEWNAKGGVLGMKIEADVADSQCEADPAVNAANNLIDQDKVHYIIGDICSRASIPISEIANQKGVVQISPISTNLQVTTNIDGSTKPYTFRACFIDPFQGTVGAKFAMENLKAQTAFVMFDQGDDYVRGLAEAFESAFTKAGGKIVGKESYMSNDKDFSAILAKVAAAKPDMIYLPDLYPIVNLVGAQAKDKGITIPMMGGDGWDSADLDVKAANNGYYTNMYDAGDTRPIVQDWVKNYGAKYNGAVPDAWATLAYDATNLMLAAIDKAGVDDPAQVAKALEGLKYDAVSGTITFDAQHNPIKSAVVIQVKDGNKQWVATVNP